MSKNKVDLHNSDLVVIQRAGSLDKLCSATFDIEISWKISLLKIAFEKAMEPIDLEQAKILNEYAEKSEDGTIKMREGTAVPVFPTDEKRQFADTRFSELLSQKSVLDMKERIKISSDDLKHSGVKLTGNDIAVLKSIVQFTGLPINI